MYLINFWEEEKWECGTEASYVECKVGHSRILVWKTDTPFVVWDSNWIEYWIINDQRYLTVILVILPGKGFIECFHVRSEEIWSFSPPTPTFLPTSCTGEWTSLPVRYSWSTEFCYQPLITFELGLAVPWLTLNSLCISALNFALQVVGILNLRHHPPFLRRGQLALYLLPFVLVSVSGLPVDCPRQLYMDLQLLRFVLS